MKGAWGHHGRCLKGTRTPRRSVLVLATALALLAVPCAGALAASHPHVIISPLDGTPDASPATQISFLGVATKAIHDVAVTGSRSGPHGGRLEAYDSAQGASFLPSKAFQEGEQVTVSALVGAAGSGVRLASHFTVAQRDLAFRFRGIPPSGPPAPGTFQSFISEPSLHPVPVTVGSDSPVAAPGDIFLTSRHGDSQPGAMILDGSGGLVWFKGLASGQAAMDLQVQSYEGKPALVWWQGQEAPLRQLGIGFGVDEVYDSSYRRVAEIRAGNGYWADLHDLQITPQGSAFITAYTLVRADLSYAGGLRDGSLQDALVQQIDIKTGLVMFEWHAWGHVALADSFAPLPRSSSEPWDWFHLNSLSLGVRGDLLVSARNTWGVYDVSLADGGVLWRLGGKKPSFHMGSGTGTAWQHDARWQPDGTITVFDDGAAPREHSQSRVIRERIDFAHRSVRLVDRYVHSPALLAGSQGNDQVLANGDSLVDWGSVPEFSEYSAEGRLLLDGRLQPPAQSYRVYKFPWSGVPYYPPSIAVKVGGGGAVRVFASWNGATGVAQWRVLAGVDPAHLASLATAPRTGFETVIALESTAPVFAVQALDAAGEVLSTSPAISAHA